MSCRCSLCSSLGGVEEVTSVATTRSREEIERHAEIHQKQLQRMMTVENPKAVDSRGPKESVTKNGASKSSGERRVADPEKRKALEDYCRAIPLNGETRDDNGVYCNLCKSNKAVRQGQHLCALFVFRHAQSHLAKLTYACRHCEKRASTEDTIRLHLKSQHNIVKNITDHFDDESDDYLEEIKEMITKCFDPRSEPRQQVNQVHNASVVAKNGRVKEATNQTLDQSNKIERHIPKRQETPMDVATSNEFAGFGMTRQSQPDFSSAPKLNVVAKPSTISKKVGIKALGQTSKDTLHVVEQYSLKTEDKATKLDDTNEKDAIFAHCRSVLPNRQNGCDTSAMCHLCHEKKVVYYNNGLAIPQSIIRHVCGHLGRSGRSFYFCKLCDVKFPKLQQMQKHLRELHQCVSTNAADNYEDKTVEFAKDIKDTITKCFGQQEPRASVQSKKRPAHVQLVKSKPTRSTARPNSSHHDRLARIRQDHCWRLVQNVRLLGRIQCKRCDVTVSFDPTQSNAPARLRCHIMVKHLPKLAVYRCRLCTFKTAVYATMKSHLNWIHHSASITGKVDNHENDFHEEIMSELSACFDSNGPMSTLGSIRNITKTTHQASMIKHRGPNKRYQNGASIGTSTVGNRKALASSSNHLSNNARSSFYRRLYEQCMKHMRKTNRRTIDCLLCSKSIIMKYGNSADLGMVLRHVESVHLRKDIYGCRRCPLRFISYNFMYRHLHGHHEVTTTKDQYTYFGEEYHVELISLLKKCFDRDVAANSMDVNQAASANTAPSAGIGITTAGDSLPAVGDVEGDCPIGSTSSKEISSSRKSYKCQICNAVFAHEMIYKKHTAFFHSDAS